MHVLAMGSFAVVIAGLAFLKAACCRGVQPER